MQPVPNWSSSKLRTVFPLPTLVKEILNMAEPLLRVTVGYENQPKMITPGVFILVVKYTPIPAAAVTDVGIVTAGSYNIFRLQLPILLKLTTVIGTVAVVADVLIVPKVAIGESCALRLMVKPMISIERKVVKSFIV